MDNPSTLTFLQRMPLFLGMSREELIEVATKIKFDFKTVEPSETVIREGDTVGRLWMLLKGTLQCTTDADDRSYRFVEEISAPTILQLENTFGVDQHSTRLYTASTTCNLVILDKNEILKLANDSLIFRLNLFNSLSTALQKSEAGKWKSTPRNLEERLCWFFIAHCLHPAGHKWVYVKMERLALVVNDSRLNVSRALHRLQDKGLLLMGRGKIEIPKIEKMRAIS
jgi:CRP-like cAMP-binding protein